MCGGRKGSVRRLNFQAEEIAKRMWRDGLGSGGAFGVPPRWASAAQDQALEAVPAGCRDSAWVLDPAASFGKVSAARSSIFRAAGLPRPPDSEHLRTAISG